MAVEFPTPKQSRTQLDPALEPDLPDLTALSLSELDQLSSFNLAITDAALSHCNQPKCTPRIAEIIEEIETRAWYFVNFIAAEAASRKPADSDDRFYRSQMMLRSHFEDEYLEQAILQLADEIRTRQAGRAQ